MRRIIASVAMVALLIGTAAPAAHAGGSTDAALGLASFAVFNQLFGGAFHHRPAVVRREVVYQQVVAPPPMVVYAAPAPAPAYPTVVQYPHGRYELRFTGQQYIWVWIPAVPAVPPPPPAPMP